MFKAIRAALEGIWQAQKVSLAEPLRKLKTNYDHALMFIALGDLLGFPFQATFYSRFLFVHWIFHIDSWKRRILKEQDVLNKISD
ncbi:MAG: hypothetical protein ACFFDJ_00720 [Candidatus Odinarchaeota archaeon]